MLSIIRKTFVVLFVAVSMVLSINAQDTKVEVGGYCPVAYLVMQKSEKVTSSVISKTLDIPPSTVRQLLRSQLNQDELYKVYLNQKPLQARYCGGKRKLFE